MLGDVCKLKNGYAFKSNNYQSVGIPVIRISDINGGVASTNKAVRVDGDIEFETYKIEPHDILVAMSGATTGKFGIYKSTQKAFQNQRVGKFKILDKNVLDNLFLFHQLHSLKRKIEKDAYGGAQPNISSTKIEQMQIVLPPLSEQEAIVSKIEELLSELENGKKQLQIAQQQLKVYRQSLLKWAFEGKLTNKNVKDRELPKGWNETELINLAKLINGDRGKNYPNRNEYVSIGIPFINTGHIEPNGNLNINSMNYITLEKFKSLNSGKVESGDLIYCLRGATMGKTAIIKQFEQGAIASSLVIVRTNEDVYNKYIYYYLLSPRGKDFIKRFDNGTAQPNLSAKSLSMFLIPLPSTKEQHQIVSELESKLTVCDKIEETISQCLQQAETLRQSILKKAFEGNLI